MNLFELVSVREDLVDQLHVVIEVYQGTISAAVLAEVQGRGSTIALKEGFSTFVIFLGGHSFNMPLELLFDKFFPQADFLLFL